MFVLDTNVISELRNPARADPKVLAWASTQPIGAQFISAITVLELEMGVLMKERKDAAQGAMLRAWLEGRVLPQFAGRVLPVDQAVALRCARLHVPDPRAERDAIIAATALVHGMSVVTRNDADFIATGVPSVNPWR
ncbi:Toxin FitB [Cupriavidus laharis]|uniref:Toxin FitB n=2 Tax=Cupriavidus laharis TaxID=151654 RepID=A0ABN7Z5A5_9BURK|nr:Toxin FitB [Cupriavidus laharis]